MPSNNNYEKKRVFEKSIFQSFLDTLYESDNYRDFIRNIQDIRHEEAPDFEVITKQPLNGIIGIELTNYLQDARQEENKGKHIIQSDLLISTVKKVKSNEPLDTGGFYGIGEELSATIKAKSEAYEKGYKEKSFLEYWLIIHSNNRHPFEFMGTANLPDILLYKCNQTMKNIEHPFHKIFLFCNEKGNEWICQISKTSQLVSRKNIR